MLQEKGLKAARTHPTAPPILRVPRDRDLPLSFSQQRLWFIDQMEPGNPAYNIAQALRLVGEIEPRLLQWIFSEIVRRHESLRTTFVSRENGPVQVIASPEPLDLSLLDLRSSVRGRPGTDSAGGCRCAPGLGRSAPQRPVVGRSLRRLSA
jgi:hypothetical protein